MNFNITQLQDYSLQSSLTQELISLYGVLTKLLLTDKINYDSTVFGDFQSIKVQKGKVYDLYMMPEQSEGFENHEQGFFSDFGMQNVESIHMFVSREDIDRVFEVQHENNEPGRTDNVDSPVKKLQSNLVILPNNRVMEITNVDFMVPGINNLFTEPDIKNVYELTMKSYDRKLTDNIKDMDAEEVQPGSYKELDSYFDELIQKDITVENEATKELDSDTDKTVIAPADSVFGRF